MRKSSKIRTNKFNISPMRREDVPPVKRCDLVCHLEKLDATAFERIHSILKSKNLSFCHMNTSLQFTYRNGAPCLLTYEKYRDDMHIGRLFMSIGAFDDMIKDIQKGVVVAHKDTYHCPFVNVCSPMIITMDSMLSDKLSRFSQFAGDATNPVKSTRSKHANREARLVLNKGFICPFLMTFGNKDLCRYLLPFLKIPEYKSLTLSSRQFPRFYKYIDIPFGRWVANGRMLNTWYTISRHPIVLDVIRLAHIHGRTGLSQLAYCRACSIQTVEDPNTLLYLHNSVFSYECDLLLCDTSTIEYLMLVRFPTNSLVTQNTFRSGLIRSTPARRYPLTYIPSSYDFKCLHALNDCIVSPNIEITNIHHNSVSAAYGDTGISVGHICMNPIRSRDGLWSDRALKIESHMFLNPYISFSDSPVITMHNNLLQASVDEVFQIVDDYLYVNSKPEINRALVDHLDKLVISIYHGVNSLIRYYLRICYTLAIRLFVSIDIFEQYMVLYEHKGNQGMLDHVFGKRGDNLHIRHEEMLYYKSSSIIGSINYMLLSLEPILRINMCIRPNEQIFAHVQNCRKVLMFGRSDHNDLQRYIHRMLQAYNIPINEGTSACPSLKSSDLSLTGVLNSLSYIESITRAVNRRFEMESETIMENINIEDVD